MKSLRFWILLLISITMVGILITGLSSAYFTTKNNLIDDSLQTNRAFSERLADNTTTLFTDMQRDLRTISDTIVFGVENSLSVDEHLKKLMVDSKHFNSMSVVNSDGVALSTYPDVGISGKKLTSTGAVEALTKRTETISEPYMAQTGRLLVLITSPLWNKSGEYLGYVGGTIYLQEENTLQKVLGTHFANDGSYVWVVSNEGNILYHPDPQRIGDTVLNNEITQKVLEKQNGGERVINTLGREFLAGYTYVPKSQWGVISQTPYEVVVKPVAGIVQKMFFIAVPFFILIVLLSVLLANLISAPLKKLALYSQQLREYGPAEAPSIPTWYFEAKQLNDTIQEYALDQKSKIDRYKETSYTDALTGLKNRWYMNSISKKWIEEETPFSAILLDIDFFKRVNDTYGHQKGDEVLQFLSEKMQNISQDNGIPLRLGGEEFLILLPHTDLQQALRLAETLRMQVENEVSPTGKVITISIGVGEYNSEEDFSDFLHRVDLSLYEAKSNGRNRVEQSIYVGTTP